MSELARRAIKALPRLTGQHGPPRPGAPEQLRVEIRAADSLLARCGTETSDLLASVTGRLCRELGVDAHLDVELRATADDPHVAVSVDDRPVLLLPVDAVTSSDRPAEMLCHHALQGVLRRLPLLLGTAADGAVASYLLAVGCAVPGDGAGAGTDVVAAERLFDASAPREVVLEVSQQTMRRVDDAGRSAVKSLRENEFRKRGVRYPDVRVLLTDHDPGAIAVRLNDVTVPLRLHADDWAHVVDRLGQELTARRHWFVRSSEVEQMLADDVEHLYPELTSAVRRAFAPEEVTACLRELLRSGRRVRNLPRIMWLMLEQGDVHGTADVLRLSEAPLTPRGGHQEGRGRDPVVLAARVRKIATEEGWRRGNPPALRQARRLAPGLEERLVTARAGAAAEAEWDVVRALDADPDAERVITRTIEAIGPVRDAIRALDRPLRVTASQELPPDIDLDRFAVLEEGRRRDDRGRRRATPRRG